MLTFDAQDPFPLLAPGSFTYPEEQAHSSAVDAWLGLETEKTETALLRDFKRAESLTERQELWIGLPVQTLLTPYTEIRVILNRLDPRPGQIVVDCGAAYGRMGFVLGRHYPEVRFIGYEFLAERVAESQRCLAPRNHPLVEMRQVDLTDGRFSPEAADFYFLYDFGTRNAIEKTLQDLKEIAVSRPIVVVGRGRSSRDAIDRRHPWLSQIFPSEHFPHYSIYRSGTTV